MTRRMLVSQVRWFPTLGLPALYLPGLVALPLALLLAVTRPLGGPDWLYGPLVFAAGLPGWHMAKGADARHGGDGWSLYGLRAQLWLYAGGAVQQAWRALRGTPPACGGHEAGG